MAMQEGLTEFVVRQLRSRCGLSHADFQVLAHLSEAPEGRLRFFELGRLLCWEKGRLSQHLSRMQARRLVTSQRCSHDLRGLDVTITAEGRQLIDRAAPQHVADVRDTVIDQLTSSELTTPSPS